MPDSAQAKTVSLSVWLVLAGAVGGIFTGIFLGDYAGALKPIGDVYAMLLEVAVYPYLICSLLHGLGRLTPAEAWRLFRSGWVYYLSLWVLVFGVLAILAWGIPPARPISFTPDSAAADGPDLLQLLIPADPFASLSQDYVPAVILFCVFFGIALQHVKEKESLLSVLESIRLTSLTFWNGVVKFAPVAVFALLGAAAGTMRVEELESLGVFLMLFFAGALGLAFWVLPALIGALTPMKMREVVPEIRSAFTIAVVTTLSVAALPFITAATMRLADRCAIDDKDRGEIVRTNISIAYPFGQLGNFFVYLFLIFAASINGVQLHAWVQGLLPPVALLSCVGSPTSSVDSVKFLSGWLGLPAGTTSFYVGLMAITRYAQVIVSVAGFAFLSFTVVLAYYGKIRLQLVRLATVLGVSLAVFGGLALAGRGISEKMQANRPDPYRNFTLDPSLVAGVKVTYGGDSNVALPGETSMARIQRTGELRVGYNDSIIPFSYRNAAGQLVGYDISYAYRLAADLNVGLRFVPFDWQSLAADLDAKRFDIAMAGIYVTDDRLVNFHMSNPYFQSPVALFMPRERVEEFRTRAGINARPGVRIGVFDDPVLMPRVKRTFPGAELVIVPDYTTVPDFTKIDAAIWTLVQAEALASVHPDLAAVEPTDVGDPYLFAYLLPPQSEQMERFINYWLQLKQSQGFEQQQRQYWISRVPRNDPAPRWSILRNVLGVGK